MPDRYAVIWTRTQSGPLKMGDLVVTDTETRFSYTHEFLDQDRADGLSLLANPRVFGNNPVVYYTKDLIPLYPRLMSLIPGRGPHNLQRRIYTRILEKRPTPPAPGLDTDWEILLLAGRNSIGHIDVFLDDRVADQWYGGEMTETLPVGKRSTFWTHLRHEIQDSVDELDSEEIARLLGPTPSVGGMTPKMLVAIPDLPQWDGRFAVPGTREVAGQAFVDAIVKVEPIGYQGVTTLEALCLQIHRELGFTVPRFWHTKLDGMNLLAVKRFDRTEDGLPIPLESFFSVFAIGDKYFQETADTDMAEVSERIARLATVVNLDTRAVQEEVYRRFVLAFFTGNGDLHLENLSFLGGADDVRLAPVYDPAPMRAWSLHNTRSAVPIIFDNAIGGLAENLIALGTAFGLSRNESEHIFHETGEVTQDYCNRVMALEAVPLPTRQSLVRIVEQERKIVGLDG